MTVVIWNVPRRLITATTEALQDVQDERFVIWTAAIGSEGRDVSVRNVVIPAQTAHTGPHGAWVHVDGDELAKIAFRMYDSGERAVAQLHTHPGPDVRMSRLDRKWEIIAHYGALSIIVPERARRGLKGFPGVNIYERGSADWRLWSQDETVERLVVVP